MSERASLGDATEMMELGAHDFWIKPVQPERLALSIGLLESKMRAQESADSQGPKDHHWPESANGFGSKKWSERLPPPAPPSSFRVKAVRARRCSLATSPAQRQASRPFIALNCAALPEGLLESELFGHEKGAFTGAIKCKEGKFELANGGTLLLDEVTEIPIHLQAKAVAGLAGRGDRPGRGALSIAVDVRVIATTMWKRRRPLLKAAFAKTSTTVERYFHSKFPPCGNGPTTWPPWSTIFLKNTTASTSAALPRSRRLPWSCCSDTAGPGMCGSWKTSSAGRPVDYRL